MHSSHISVTEIGKDDEHRQSDDIEEHAVSNQHIVDDTEERKDDAYEE